MVLILTPIPSALIPRRSLHNPKRPLQMLSRPLTNHLISPDATTPNPLHHHPHIPLRVHIPAFKPQLLIAIPRLHARRSQQPLPVPQHVVDALGRIFVATLEGGVGVRTIVTAGLLGRVFGTGGAHEAADAPFDDVAVQE